MELLGLVILGISVPVHATCVRHFLVRGSGTPLPFAPPRLFVAGGPYRYSRNPMALCAVAECVGASLYFAAPLGLLPSAAFAIVLYLYITRREEPELARRFGSSYVAYCEEVPRWIPSVRRTRTAA